MMGNFQYKNSYIFILFSIFSGTLYALSSWYPILGYSIWLTQIPFFIAVLQCPAKLWKLGLSYGTAYGFIFFLWVPDIVQNISGSSFLLPGLSYVFISLYIILFPLLFTLFVGLGRKRFSFNQIHWIWLVPALWVITEWSNTILISHFPWAPFFIGYRQANNLLALQVVSISGIMGLSFLIILINTLFAFFFIQKHYKWPIVALSILIVLHVYGYLSLQHFNTQKSDQTIKTALIVENVNSSTGWNDATGDSLSQMLFDLNRQAVQDSPKLVLWSETALPWVLQPDDQFIPLVLQITWPAQCTHILGINTEGKKQSGNVYNSALCIHPDGRISDMYHKQNLLWFIEQPVKLLPFAARLQQERYRSSVYDNVEAGTRPGVMRTSEGLAGVRICNEWIIPGAIRSAVQQGAELLLNMSNNGYMEHPFLPQIQWIETRTRAVENRRDVAIACNYGFSGHIAASGKIVHKQRSRQGAYIPVNLEIHTTQTLYTKLGDWFPLLCAFACVVFAGVMYFKKK